MEHTRKRASSGKSLRALKELKKSESSDDERPDDNCLHKAGRGLLSNGETGRTGGSELDTRWGDKTMEGDIAVKREASEDMATACKKDLVGPDVLAERNHPPREDGHQKTQREGKPKKSKSRKQPDQQKKMYICVCGKSYTRRSSLHRHAKIHGEETKGSGSHRDGEPREAKATSEKSFLCICGKSYTISSHLYRHQKTCQAKSLTNHVADAEEGRLKPYTCACGKSYTCSSHLYRHQRSHLGGTCDCGKVFSSESSLYRHRKTHTQDTVKIEQDEGDSVEGTEALTPGKMKPYLCPCGKSYTCSSHLYRHQRTHQVDNVSVGPNKTEKRYKCECGKSYTCTSHLYRHQRTHKTQELLVDDLDCPSDFNIEDFEEKPHQCECGKSFILWFSLMVHKRIHCKAKRQASSEQNGY